MWSFSCISITGKAPKAVMALRNQTFVHNGGQDLLIITTQASHMLYYSHFVTGHQAMVDGLLGAMERESPCFLSS